LAKYLLDDYKTVMDLENDWYCKHKFWKRHSRWRNV
jgi:hypothetical protein